MKRLEELTIEDIDCMDYNDLISVTHETNRPPGGYNSLSRIAQNSFISQNKRILEVGTSTGFTAIELTRLTGANITAIDINERSLIEAKRRADLLGVGNNITFELGDTTKLKYDDSSFDLVFCGNVTSIVSDRDAALTEYNRVLKPDGFLAAIPMYYRKEPSAELISKVSDAIHVRITPQYKSDWISFFNKEPFSIRFSEDYEFNNTTASQIETFVSSVLARPHLQTINAPVRNRMAERYTEFMHLFGNNLSHMGYTILLLRKESDIMDPELYTSSRVLP